MMSDDLKEKINILMVDDKPENLLSLEAILDSNELNLVKANSGKEALEKVLDNDFAIILMDVQMPEMDGFETAELIRGRKKTSHIPIIFVTAISKEERYAFKGYMIGAVDYLHKPVNPDVLKSKIHVFVDLYRQRKLIENQAQELDKANKLKDRFLSMASHDLKSPISAITGIAGLLRDGIEGEVNDDQTYCLKRIVTQCQYMTGLINELLDVCALQTGNLSMKLSSQNPHVLLQDAWEMFEFRAKEKEIQLKIEFEKNLPMISFDFNRMLEVLSNFISNAIKFCDSGDTVTIGAQLIEGEVKIWVKDTGPGIKEEEKKLLFKPFTKLSNEPTGDESSTGLGLSIAKEIVTLHQGSVDVSSTYGEGTCFTISLPATSLGITILWVDDEEDLTYIIKSSLPHKIQGDVKILSACDGVEALDVIENNYVDLIVSDVVMPRMDGIELLDKIKNDYPEKKFILTTANEDRINVREALTRGASAYIRKPFEIDKVKKVVERVLHFEENEEKSEQA